MRLSKPWLTRATGGHRCLCNEGRKNEVLIILQKKKKKKKKKKRWRRHNKTLMVPWKKGHVKSFPYHLDRPNMKNPTRVSNKKYFNPVSNFCNLFSRDFSGYKIQKWVRKFRFTKIKDGGPIFISHYSTNVHFINLNFLPHSDSGIRKIPRRKFYAKIFQIRILNWGQVEKLTSLTKRI